MSNIEERLLPVCRICFEEEGDKITPCKCNSLVHPDCLNRWRKQIPLILHNNKRDIRCEICLEYYQFEGEINHFKYNKCLIVWDMIKLLVPLQIIGFLIGMIITGFGQITTLIFTNYINIYLYQYLLGNLIINIIIGIIFLFNNTSSTTNDCFYCDACFCCIYTDLYIDNSNCDCCICILAIMFVTGLFFIITGVYYIALQKSKKRQLILNDNRIVKDLGINYV